jgi:hypothetical protein
VKRRNLDARIEQLERKTGDGQARSWFIVDEVDGRIEHEGNTYADLDAWKQAVGFGDNDRVAVFKLRRRQ